MLLISADTLRYDHVGANGYGRDTTPNIDALAAEGVNFSRAYTHAPSTASSHTSVLSSLYPSVHKVREHGQELDQNVVTLPESFQAAGYATAAFTQLNGPTYRQGFETYVFLKRPDRDKLGDLSPVIDWLDQPRDAPFFLFLHSYDVHLPYDPPEEYIERWAPDYDGPLPRSIFWPTVVAINAGKLELTERDYQFILDLYDAELLRYDEKLGELSETLRMRGWWDDTIVVLFSDHGEEFGEHGQWGRHAPTLYDELLRTPLIIRGPGVPAGQSLDAVVRNIDIAPTLLKLAEIDVPELFMGEPLQEVWAHRDPTPRRVIAEGRRRRVLVWAGYKYRSDGKLFDLQADTHEQVDIAAEDPDILARMHAELDRWSAEVAVPAASIETSSSEKLTAKERRRLRALGYVQ